MDFRTSSEIRFHQIVLELMHYLQGGKISRLGYQSIMGQLRDLHVELENKRFGCASGRHTRSCECRSRAA